MSKQKLDKVKKLSEGKLLMKIEESSLFVGFYLKTYARIEQITPKQVMKTLGMGDEQYRKLAYYRIDQNNIVGLCDSASKELNFKSGSLLAVIRHVQAFEKIRSMPPANVEGPGLLMAARKKVKKK